VLASGYMDHHVAYSVGAVEAQLGRPASAVKWLRQAADSGFQCLQWVERDALLDPIRRNPEFQAFLTVLRDDYDRARGRYAAVLQLP